jgi:hypothetical protein
MEETMKENVTDPAEETATVQVAPNKKHSVTNLIREMWPAYLIEIFVIILGISISLVLEEWRDRGKEHQLENIYLRNLIADVETDSVSLRNAIDGTQILLGSGNQLLAYSRAADVKNISFSQIKTDVRSILGRPNFISSDATFSDLKSSGNLHLIKDIGLKNLLFGYYGETQRINEVQNAEQQSTIVLSGSYFLKSFPIDSAARPAQTPDDLHLLSDIQFENNVLLRLGNREELLSIYRKTDSIGTLLRNALSRKIH